MAARVGHVSRQCLAVCATVCATGARPGVQHHGVRQIRADPEPAPGWPAHPRLARSGGSPTQRYMRTWRRAAPKRKHHPGFCVPAPASAVARRSHKIQVSFRLRDRRARESRPEPSAGMYLNWRPLGRRPSGPAELAPRTAWAVAGALRPCPGGLFAPVAVGRLGSRGRRGAILAPFLGFGGLHCLAAFAQCLARQRPPA